MIARKQRVIHVLSDRIQNKFNDTHSINKMNRILKLNLVNVTERNQTIKYELIEIVFPTNWKMSGVIGALQPLGITAR